ncbi:ATP synthase subunit 9, mitochondrial [Capsicum annuum]|nr:ATP synthase subunit 9, mitochondrial [Capsicum annuum]KAF3648739.1 ATP synthase subunit 9, mitochondrial [Capsicum annuum]
MLEGAKSMGAGAATIASAGAAIGIGNVLSSSIHSVARNQSLAKQLFGYAILGFALTEAIASFAPMMAFEEVYIIAIALKTETHSTKKARAGRYESIGCREAQAIRSYQSFVRKRLRIQNIFMEQTYEYAWIMPILAKPPIRAIVNQNTNDIKFQYVRSMSNLMKGSVRPKAANTKRVLKRSPPVRDWDLDRIRASQALCCWGTPTNGNRDITICGSSRDQYDVC